MYEIMNSSKVETGERLRQSGGVVVYLIIIDIEAGRWGFDSLEFD
jgi:hypothetical protein